MRPSAHPAVRVVTLPVVLEVGGGDEYPFRGDIGIIDTILNHFSGPPKAAGDCRNPVGLVIVRFCCVKYKSRGQGD